LVARPVGWRQRGEASTRTRSTVSGLGHDRRDRVTGREPAGQRAMAEKRADQRFASVIVEPVPGPEGGDVGCFGERVGGFLAAVASGEPVVASLGMKDGGQVTDVVLAAAVYPASSTRTSSPTRRPGGRDTVIGHLRTR
jgi:hypothetical protein